MVVVGTDKIMVFDEFMVLKASTIWWFLTSWRIRRDVFKCWCFMMSWCLLTSWCFFWRNQGSWWFWRGDVFFDESEIWTSWRFKQVDVFWRGDFFDDSDEVIVWTSSCGFWHGAGFDELMIWTRWCFLGWGDDFDELSWRVTGWTFRIGHFVTSGFDELTRLHKLTGFWQVFSFDELTDGFCRVDSFDELTDFSSSWQFWSCRARWNWPFCGASGGLCWGITSTLRR